VLSGIESLFLSYKEVAALKCPFCEKELPGAKCPYCGAVGPEEANYCIDCGRLMRGDKDESDFEDASSGTDEDSFDFENRVLCPDGTCTGIIVNGKCTECGKPYKG